MVGCWRSCLTGARCRLAYGPADATATHCLLLQHKIQIGFTFLVPAHRGSPGQGPLNGCVYMYWCVCVCAGGRRSGAGAWRRRGADASRHGRRRSDVAVDGRQVALGRAASAPAVRRRGLPDPRLHGQLLDQHSVVARH